MCFELFKYITFITTSKIILKTLALPIFETKNPVIFFDQNITLLTKNGKLRKICVFQPLCFWNYSCFLQVCELE